MTIRPPAGQRPRPAVPDPDPAAKAPSRAGPNSFAEALASALKEDGKNPTSAEAAVELVRLERLRTALEPAAGEGLSVGPSPVVSALLEAFASEGRQPEPAGAAPEPPLEPAPIPPKPTGGLPDIVARAARSSGLEPGLLWAVIRAESGLDPRAVSPAGAQGLMQLMPETARALGVSDPFDPEQNVQAGARYLRGLLDRYGGDLDTALAAYNWGPANVDRGGGALPQETRAYLARIKELLARG